MLRGELQFCRTRGAVLAETPGGNIEGEHAVGEITGLEGKKASYRQNHNATFMVLT